MKTVAKSKATNSLAHYVDSLGDDTIVVTRNGRPIAALVSLQNADAETVKLSTDPAFLRLIERSRQKHQSQGGLSSAEIRERLGLRGNGKRG